jgi:hypothetical protein
MFELKVLLDCYTGQYIEIFQNIQNLSFHYYYSHSWNDEYTLTKKIADIYEKTLSGQLYLSFTYQNCI